MHTQERRDGGKIVKFLIIKDIVVFGTDGIRPAIKEHPIQ